MSNEISEEEYWKKKIKEHWKAFAILIAAGVCLVAWAIAVFFWFMYITPIGANGTLTIDLWTLEMVLLFMIFSFLFELLFVGVPAALFFGVGGYIWWRRLPAEEKQEFKDREKKKTHKARNAGGGGGGGFFMFIVYYVYMVVIGFYNVPFGNQPYIFWIIHCFLALMWMLIVLGGPALIIIIIVYFTVWRKKSE